MALRRQAETHSMTKPAQHAKKVPACDNPIPFGLGAAKWEQHFQDLLKFHRLTWVRGNDLEKLSPGWQEPLAALKYGLS